MKISDTKLARTDPKILLAKGRVDYVGQHTANSGMNAVIKPDDYIDRYTVYERSPQPTGFQQYEPYDGTTPSVTNYRHTMGYNTFQRGEVQLAVQSTMPMTEHDPFWCGGEERAESVVQRLDHQMKKASLAIPDYDKNRIGINDPEVVWDPHPMPNQPTADPFAHKITFVLPTKK